MESKEHIVMLPFMAHGHLIPFLALARKFHRRTGFKITIANTPLNVQYLRSTMDSDDDDSTNIHLISLPLCTTDYGLPPNTENSENLPLDIIGSFFTASTSLQNPFHQLLCNITAEESRPPLCIISDVFFGWANDVAKAVGTVNVPFSTGGAYGTLAYLSLWLNLPHRNTDSDEFHVPGFPGRCRFHITQLHQFIRNADGNDLWSRFMQPQFSLSMKNNSVGWLCNTAEEIEPLGLEWLRNYMKLPVWTIGPLIPPLAQRSTGKQPGLPTQICLEWLDLHSPGSVVYVSFGSQNSISASQMKELAIGLEESAKAFIWVVRPPIGFDRKGEFRDEWLPDEFEVRMKNKKQGLLVRNWAPQLEILSHKSTGAFLSHCGWNSVMESLSQGVPIIAWPLAAEQAYNSKMLVEEMGVCVELTRGLDSDIGWKKVKCVIELVMGNKGKGQDMKKKAVAIGEQIKAAVKEDEEEKGSAIKAVDNLVSTLQSLRQVNELQRSYKF